MTRITYFVPLNRYLTTKIKNTMPNHIKNKIELLGDIADIDAMVKRFGERVPASIKKTHDDKEVICKGKEEYSFCWLDLSTGRATNRSGLNQIGLPAGYEIKINDSFLSFPDFEKVIPPPNDPAYKDLPSQKEAEKSPNWWYRWNIDNWGTKWGSYACEQEALNIYTFETAWSPAPKIIEVMSKVFPNVTIKYTWSDEDTGHNCGREVYHNGLLERDVPEGGSVKAYEIAFELRPDRADNYELVDGKYKYKEED